jgi:transposase-like protein
VLHWSRAVPTPSRCPQCRSTRIFFVIPDSPEIQSWRCGDCDARWEIGPGGHVVLPLTKAGKDALKNTDSE